MWKSDRRYRRLWPHSSTRFVSVKFLQSKHDLTKCFCNQSSVDSIDKSDDVWQTIYQDDDRIRWRFNIFYYFIIFCCCLIVSILFYLFGFSLFLSFLVMSAAEKKAASKSTTTTKKWETTTNIKFCERYKSNSIRLRFCLSTSILSIYFSIRCVDELRRMRRYRWRARRSKSARCVHAYTWRRRLTRSSMLLRSIVIIRLLMIDLLIFFLKKKK